LKPRNKSFDFDKLDLVDFDKYLEKLQDKDDDILSSDSSDGDGHEMSSAIKSEIIHKIPNAKVKEEKIL
jgi:hypothetical protein